MVLVTTVALILQEASKARLGLVVLLQVVHLTIPDGVPRITREVVGIPEVVFTGGEVQEMATMVVVPQPEAQAV